MLSVVCQTYMQASSEIHDFSMTAREETINLAFQALSQSEGKNQPAVIGFVDLDSVEITLRLLRPHYNTMKINA